MEEPSYSVRFRGVISGPFDLRQLKAMRKLERLARFHEVSADGETWLPATSIPALFPPATPRLDPEAGRGLTAGNLESHVHPPEGGAIEVAQVPSAWFYADGDASVGPISFDELQRLVGQGELMRETLVWTEGMTTWLPYHEVALSGHESSDLPEGAMSNDPLTAETPVDASKRKAVSGNQASSQVNQPGAHPGRRIWR